MRVETFGSAHAQEWDGFCSRAANGTFQHTRKFLSYHRDRFVDASVLIFDEADRLIGLLPAARDPRDATRVVSHPGATYGGLVHEGRLNGARMLQAMVALRTYYTGLGVRALRYKCVPQIHRRQPAEDDVYALWRQGAELGRCDLSCALDLQDRRQPSERRRRGLKKAEKVVVVSADEGNLAALWQVVVDNLAREHGASPVHSLSELEELRQLFPFQIQLRCALLDGQVVAGVVFFNAGPSWHAQYIAADEKAYEVSALDAVFEAAINDARVAGARWFDFGTSNESEGRVLNDDLYRYKAEHGGGGIAHLTFDLNLGQGAP